MQFCSEALFIILGEMVLPSWTWCSPRFVLIDDSNMFLFQVLDHHSHPRAFHSSSCTLFICLLKREVLPHFWGFQSSCFLRVDHVFKMSDRYSGINESFWKCFFINNWTKFSSPVINHFKKQNCLYHGAWHQVNALKCQLLSDQFIADVGWFYLWCKQHQHGLYLCLCRMYKFTSVWTLCPPFCQASGALPFAPGSDLPRLSARTSL